MCLHILGWTRVGPYWADRTLSESWPAGISDGETEAHRKQGHNAYDVQLDGSRRTDLANLNRHTVSLGSSLQGVDIGGKPWWTCFCLHYQCEQEGKVLPFPFGS